MDPVTSLSIEEKIQAFLRETYPLARKSGMEANAPLLESGILDSLGILGVVTFLEGEFSITISDDELVPENFQSIRALSSFVRMKNGKDQ